MGRVLHLIAAPDHCDSGNSHQGGNAMLIACRSVVRRCRAWRHEVALLAGTRGARRAAALGLDCAVRIAPPAGRPELAAWGVERGIGRAGAPEIVMCWDAAGARVADRLALRSSARYDLDPDTGDLRNTVAAPVRLRAQFRRRAGVVSADARRMLRARLGVAESELVLPLVGSTTHGAVELSFVLGILNVANVPCVGLVERGAESLTRALRHVREGGYIRRLMVVDGPIERYYGACDVGVFAPRDEPVGFSGRLAIAQAMGCGLGVIAPRAGGDDPDLPACLRDCLSPAPHAADLTRVAFRVLCQPGRTESIRAALRDRVPGGSTPLWAQIERVWSHAGVAT